VTFKTDEGYLDKWDFFIFLFFGPAERSDAITEPVGVKPRRQQRGNGKNEEMTN